MPIHNGSIFRENAKRNRLGGQIPVKIGPRPYLPSPFLLFVSILVGFSILVVVLVGGFVVVVAFGLSVVGLVVVSDDDPEADIV